MSSKSPEQEKLVPQSVGKDVHAADKAKDDKKNSKKDYERLYSKD